MFNPSVTYCRVNELSDSLHSEMQIEPPHLPINYVSRHAEVASNCFGGLPVCKADKDFLSEGRQLPPPSLIHERNRTKTRISHKRNTLIALIIQTTRKL